MLKLFKGKKNTSNTDETSALIPYKLVVDDETQLYIMRMQGVEEAIACQYKWTPKITDLSLRHMLYATSFAFDTFLAGAAGLGDTTSHTIATCLSVGFNTTTQGMYVYNAYKRLIKVREDFLAALPLNHVLVESKAKYIGGVYGGGIVECLKNGYSVKVSSLDRRKTWTLEPDGVAYARQVGAAGIGMAFTSLLTAGYLYQFNTIDAPIESFSPEYWSQVNSLAMAANIPYAEIFVNMEKMWRKQEAVMLEIAGHVVNDRFGAIGNMHNVPEELFNFVNSYVEDDLAKKNILLRKQCIEKAHGLEVNNLKNIILEMDEELQIKDEEKEALKIQLELNNGLFCAFAAVTDNMLTANNIGDNTATNSSSPRLR